MLMHGPSNGDLYIIQPLNSYFRIGFQASQTNC